MSKSPAVSSLISKQSSQRIAIYRYGSKVPLLVQNAVAGKRPFIHPITSPDGDGILTEDAPPHHAWQHGLYVGLNDVSGIGFWTEGLTGNPSDGTFHPLPLAAAVVEGDCAKWRVVSDWLGPDRQKRLTEIQSWTLRDCGTYYELDLSWSLTAAIELTFGQYAYGGLFVRMPFRTSGTVVDSEGRHGIDACEGQRSRWVAIAMPIPDRTAVDSVVGLAMMDHPKNPEHPTPWRVDGQFGIAPSRCIAGAWNLAAGKTTTSRYRVFIHAGATSIETIENSWARFVC